MGDPLETKEINCTVVRRGKPMSKQKKNPNIILLNNETFSSVQAEIDGKWVPLRPLGLSTIENRIKAAWLVFTGKADALIWPEGQ